MRMIATALLLVIPVFAVAAPPKGFDARVEALMRQMEVPGATVAIVENGAVTLARGYGLRSQGGTDAVGPDTLFQIGSTTKAFTSAALAILVDEGKLRWDDRVIDHLPGFQMYDPWVTREITVRDLLVHRSGLGLGHGDLLFVPATNLSREETVRRVRFLKPATSFRSAYAYDNILYIVAGALIEAVSGQRWEEFVEARIFAPLGMNRSVSNDPDRLAVADRVREIDGHEPHARLDQSPRQQAALTIRRAPVRVAHAFRLLCQIERPLHLRRGQHRHCRCLAASCGCLHRLPVCHRTRQADRAHLEARAFRGRRRLARGGDGRPRR